MTLSQEKYSLILFLVDSFLPYDLKYTHLNLEIAFERKNNFSSIATFGKVLLNVAKR